MDLISHSPVMVLESRLNNLGIFLWHMLGLLQLERWKTFFGEGSKSLAPLAKELGQSWKPACSTLRVVRPVFVATANPEPIHKIAASP